MMTIDCLAHSQIIKIKKVRETGTGGFGGGWKCKTDVGFTACVRLLSRF